MSAATGEAATAHVSAVYYPGTPDIAAAQRITVGVGQQLAEVGFPLSSIPTRNSPGPPSIPMAAHSAAAA